MDFVLYNAEQKWVQLLLIKPEHVVGEIEIQIEIEISNDYTTTRTTKLKHFEETHAKFRQQLENRRAKK